MQEISFFSLKMQQFSLKRTRIVSEVHQCQSSLHSVGSDVSSPFPPCVHSS